jgi:hypothetical protein
MNLCKYKAIFGKPNEGVHSYRVFNFAIVDVLATLLVAYIISTVYKYSFLYTSAILFLLGIFMHSLFCVDTQVAKLLN